MARKRKSAPPAGGRVESENRASERRRTERRWVERRRLERRREERRTVERRGGAVPSCGLERPQRIISLEEWESLSKRFRNTLEN